jgi:HopA1 effector protein family
MCESAALTARLYGFNRWPLSPKLMMSLPGQRELREFVLKEGPAELTQHWRSQRYKSRPGWLSWVRREWPRGLPEITYKLYVSPAPTSVCDVLRGLVPELTESRCIRFKVGATPADLARPDKLVAYFGDREEALRVADVLRKRLDGVPAHGVPLSVPFNSNRLLSWGIDPPYKPERPTSWRMWLCSEIAQAMTASQSGGRVAAANSRLAAIGIDPDSWEPSSEFRHVHEAN